MSDPQRKTIGEYHVFLASPGDVNAADDPLHQLPPQPRDFTGREAELTDTPVDFVILTALQEEFKAVTNSLPCVQQLPPNHDDDRVYFLSQLPVTFPDGSLGQYRIVVLCLPNMGRVEASAATNDAIRRWHPRFVLLFGIAGGIAEQGVQLGDVLISDQIVDYELQKIETDGPKIRYQVYRASPRLLNAATVFQDDAWIDRIRSKRPRKGKPARHVGPIATGDKIIAFSDALQKYRYHWPKMIGVEMKAGGAAHATFQTANPPDFFMIRAVSDLGVRPSNTA